LDGKTKLTWYVVTSGANREEEIYQGDNEADARLVSAAPDLLAALQNILDRGGHLSPFGGEASVAAVRKAGKYVEAVDAARAAIAKATGGAS
jgi:hypothetical protein